jgi:hypothetical protein
MTKTIRIENADNSDHLVRVEPWDIGQNGEPDRLDHTDHIDHPTFMVSQTIHSGRYIVIRES